MNYFIEQYPHVSWPIDSAVSAGLRPPQLGALHAVAGHFAQHDEPAIVTMPTGSGKTAVLAASPFVLRAQRALVVTPSRLVREQIVDDLASLDVLRRLGVLPPDTPLPTVVAVRERVRSSEEWAALESADIVVGIPSSLDPTRADVPPPPAGLFDVVLVDEAHHSAATTWRALLSQFRGARQVLFTATPFRRDRRDLLGRFVYNYELARAFRDGVFGRLRYMSVEPNGVDPDVAIATAATAAVLTDRSGGLDHRLMVRAGTRARAEELAALYAAHTPATLELVLGHHSLRHVRQVLGRLRAGSIDGIICVDMFGEGFDLPQLKVAALHSPHRSLAITLQFIGRFARTTAANLGEARFFALASDMEVERERLYRQGAVWEDIIPGLSSARVREEHRTREVLADFVSRTVPSPTSATGAASPPDLSLHTIRPSFHVKVLRAGPGVDPSSVTALPRNLDVVYRWTSDDGDTAVFVTREVSRPAWATVEQFDGVEHDLFILHLHVETNYLFICASRRTDAVYQHFAAACAPMGGPPLRSVPPAVLNKVLLDLEAPRFFSVGKRNAVAANRSVSYETHTGSAADDHITQSDARAYRRGHWFCAATENGQSITLGLSSASKVWSSASGRIPRLMDWCDRLAHKLSSTRTPSTSSNIDLLSAGVEATTFPDDIMFADWDRRTYDAAPVLRCEGSGGDTRLIALLDFDLTVEAADPTHARVRLSHGEVTGDLVFSFSSARLIEPAANNAWQFFLAGARDGSSLIEHLNEYPPSLYTSDFSCLTGFALHTTSIETQPFDANRIEVMDWSALGVDSTLEFGAPSPRGMSIHAYLEQSLAASDADVVVYDHGSGEVADFITCTVRDAETHVTLYHCKASGDPTPRERVGDVYDVCGQVGKSTIWTDKRVIRDRLLTRLQSRPGGGTRFIKGDTAMLRHVLRDGPVRPRFEMVVVQPGISASDLSPKTGSVLAAADGYIFGGRCARLRVWGAA